MNTTAQWLNWWQRGVQGWLRQFVSPCDDTGFLSLQNRSLSTANWWTHMHTRATIGCYYDAINTCLIKIPRNKTDEGCECFGTWAMMMFITGRSPRLSFTKEGRRWVLLKRPRCDIDGVGEGSGRNFKASGNE